MTRLLNSGLAGLKRVLSEKQRWRPKTRAGQNEKVGPGSFEWTGHWCTKSVPGVVALRSKWAAGKARGGRISESIRTRHATPPPAIFIATLRAARLLAGCFVAHRSKTTAGILPLRFAHPAKIRGGAAIPVTDLVH